MSTLKAHKRNTPVKEHRFLNKLAKLFLKRIKKGGLMWDTYQASQEKQHAS